MKLNQLLALFTAIAPVFTAKQNCGSDYIRKEFRECTEHEIKNYIDGSTGHYIDDFTNAHHEAIGPHHSGTASFLPWHRLLLSTLEAAMRECTGNNEIFIPYWDNGLDSQSPEKSLIWNYFGKDGNINNDQIGRNEEDIKNYGECVDGPLKGVLFQHVPPDMINQSPDCLRRDFGARSTNAETFTLVTLEVIDLIIREKDFGTMCAGLEGLYHGKVHAWVGGHMGGLETATNDPIFYMHHANVDRLWSEWQLSNPDLARTYIGKNAEGEPVNEADLLELYNPETLNKYYDTRPVSDMYDTNDWCYKYTLSVIPAKQDGTPINSTSSGSPNNKDTPSSDNREDLFNQRTTKPYTAKAIKRLHLNMEQTGAWEELTNDYIRYINSLEGYVSYDALINHRNQKYISTPSNIYEDLKIVRGMLLDNFKQLNNLPESLKVLMDAENDLDELGKDDEENPEGGGAAGGEEDSADSEGSDKSKPPAEKPGTTESTDKSVVVDVGDKDETQKEKGGNKVDDKPKKKENEKKSDEVEEKKDQKKTKEESEKVDHTKAHKEHKENEDGKKGHKEYKEKEDDKKGHKEYKEKEDGKKGHKEYNEKKEKDVYGKANKNYGNNNSNEKGHSDKKYNEEKGYEKQIKWKETEWFEYEKPANYKDNGNLNSNSFDEQFYEDEEDSDFYDE
ncbi:hypothetical protein HK099_003604 [Clydaea vesicula]|uniref:Tyrosinase copper-binding domain-containing protein n=1 Tax=Clydaea vesicula TaxID=447962 RepID=A0AAD5U3C8_9FUNG|nr:hypothetical protein HK099_003604 [Clydaea vesicula]